MFYCLTKMFKNSSVREKKLMKNQTPTEYNITNRGGLIVAEKFSELLVGHPAVCSSSPVDCSNCSLLPPYFAFAFAFVLTVPRPPILLLLLLLF